VLLADEPTGNLDEDTRDDIIALLEGLWRDQDLTMVLVTHDSAIARRAQRRGVMKYGKLTISNDARHAPANPQGPHAQKTCRHGRAETNVRGRA
jgi:putative ABC transport system ATP-binding protein